MPSTKQVPFDLKERALKHFESFDQLARWLADEITNAQDVRTQTDTLLDYWHRLYEQDRTRLTTNTPTPDGADLTSYIGAQQVDSLHARIMQTLFVEPIWTVEGWATSVQRAPFVEAFHQWTAEDERVQSYVDRVIHNSLIDTVGILEVYEEIDYQPVRKTIWAQVETVMDERGQPRAVFDENTRPQFVMQRGEYVEVPKPADDQPISEGIAEITMDSYEPVRVGPGYAVIDFSNFWVLPGHATDKRDIWGYAKRVFRRMPYLTQKAQDGIYDTKALKAIGDDNERDATLEDARLGRTIAQQEGPTAEKELYEVAFQMDLDGAGSRWWVATVHVKTPTMLRLKYDDLGTQIGFGRFLRFVPLPRKNSLDGFSVIGHKLITLIEEHTAVRNMRADRSALAGNMVLKVKQNALYDPEEVPIGPGSIIWVREQDDVQPMEFPDVPASVNQWEREILDGVERTMGINDIATGITPQQDRTLGEVQLTAGYSEVRMSLITKRLQETMEDLWQIRHVIWKRVLANQSQGVDIPQRAMYGLEARGVDLQLIPGGTFTAQLLEGKFRGKPRGSVETADLNRLRQDFVQLLATLPRVLQVNPLVAAAWQTPQAARALNEQIVKLFRFPDQQAVLGMPGQEASATSGLIQDPRIQQMLQQFGARGGGQSGMPPAEGGGAGEMPIPPMPETMGVQ